jgi:hypothetical protein
MIGLHRKEKVVVSVNRVGMACGEVGKRTGLNGIYSSTTARFFIYHGEVGGWNFYVGDGFLSQHWFSWSDFQVEDFGKFAFY